MNVIEQNDKTSWVLKRVRGSQLFHSLSFQKCPLKFQCTVKSSLLYVLVSAVPLQKCPLACKLWVRLKSGWYGQGGPKMQISELNIREYKLQILEFHHSRSTDGPFLWNVPTFSASIFFLDFEPCGNIVSAQRVESKAIIGGVESVPNLMLWSSTFYTRFVHYLVKFMVVHTNSAFHKHVISKTFSDVVWGGCWTVVQYYLLVGSLKGTDFGPLWGLKSRISTSYFLSVSDITRHLRRHLILM